MADPIIPLGGKIIWKGEDSDIWTYEKREGLRTTVKKADGTTEVRVVEKFETIQATSKVNQSGEISAFAHIAPASMNPGPAGYLLKGTIGLPGPGQDISKAEYKFDWTGIDPQNTGVFDVSFTITGAILNLDIRGSRPNRHTYLNDIQFVYVGRSNEPFVRLDGEEIPLGAMMVRSVPGSANNFKWSLDNSGDGTFSVDFLQELHLSYLYDVDETTNHIKPLIAEVKLTGNIRALNVII